MTTIREHLSQAIKFHKEGALTEARNLYLKVLNEQPDHADALNLLGVLSLQSRHYDEALDYLKQAITSDEKAAYYNNLGLVYKHLNNLEDAQKNFETALDIESDYLDSVINLASLWQQSDRINEAHALLNAHLQKGINHPQYLFNFSSVCIKVGALTSAREAIEKLLVIAPDDPGALFNYGMLLKNAGDIDKATAVFERLVADPVKGDKAKWFLSQCLLLKEEFAKGWRYFSSRFKALDIEYKEIDLPEWVIGQSENEGLLVWAEQGVGDELFFASHIPLLQAHFSHIYYECDERLKPLFERTYKDIYFFNRTNEAQLKTNQLNVQVHCAAGDVIRYTNPDLKQPKANFKFLKVDQEQSKAFQLPSSTSLNIGLSYFTKGSNAQHRMPPEDFWDVLSRLEGKIQLIDLQSNRYRSFPAPESLHEKRLLQQIDTIDLYGDIDGLAALISNLDHVISIDNAVAHLASNLGIPTILLLSTVHDWRWLQNKRNLPWYPKTTLIRQKEEGNWDNVQAELLINIESLLGISTQA